MTEIPQSVAASWYDTAKWLYTRKEPVGCGGVLPKDGKPIKVQEDQIKLMAAGLKKANGNEETPENVTSWVWESWSEYYTDDPAWRPNIELIDVPAGICPDHPIIVVQKGTAPPQQIEKKPEVKDLAAQTIKASNKPKALSPLPSGVLIVSSGKVDVTLEKCDPNFTISNVVVVEHAKDDKGNTQFKLNSFDVLAKKAGSYVVLINNNGQVSKMQVTVERAERVKSTGGGEPPPPPPTRKAIDTGSEL